MWRGMDDFRPPASRLLYTMVISVINGIDCFMVPVTVEADYDEHNTSLHFDICFVAGAKSCAARGGQPAMCVAFISNCLPNTEMVPIIRISSSQCPSRSVPASGTITFVDVVALCFDEQPSYSF